MNLTTIILIFPIFMVLYSGMGLLLNSRKKTMSFGHRRSKTTLQAIQDLAGTLGTTPINRAILRRISFRQRLEDLLMRSGYPFGWKAADLLSVKELTLALSVIAVWQFDPRNPWAWIIGLLMGFMLPDIALQMQGSSRKAAMQRSLPGLIDLLALALESGLDFIVSVERITDKMEPSALREELQVLLQESRLGSPRREILQRWAHRTGLADAQSLASLVIQSEEMGTPLTTVLRNYAEDMRSRRILRAEEIAGKIPVKILFPMMLFFFPIVFVIILGPVALEFFKNYK